MALTRREKLTRSPIYRLGERDLRRAKLKDRNCACLLSRPTHRADDGIVPVCESLADRSY
jgi:hypothetical protein